MTAATGTIAAEQSAREQLQDLVRAFEQTLGEALADPGLSLIHI